MKAKIVQSLVVLNLALASTSNAFASASTFALAQDMVGLKLIAGQLVRIETRYPDCPDYVQCGPMSVAKISFTLQCGSVLGPVTAHFGKSRSTIDLHVTAYEALTQRSGRGNACLTDPVQTIEIPLGDGYISRESVKVTFENSLLSENE